MSGHDDILDEIAGLVGLGRRYRDLEGRTVETSRASRLAVLEGLGLEVGSEGGARDALERVRRLKCALVPRLVPAVAGRAVAVPLRAPGAAIVSYRIVDERGTVREGRSRRAPDGDEAAFVLPALGPGYHRLDVRVGSEAAQATVIAAPSRCYVPNALRGEARLWGTTAQLYGLRSARNLGIGDYGDVAEAAERTAALGASFLGLSPVHALFAADRGKVSPYSPSSRLFLETLFIDPAAVPGFAECAAPILADAAFRDRLAACREAALVDHAAVAAVQMPLLEALWQTFQGNPDPEFDLFRRRGGGALEAHATFEALSEAFKAKGLAWAGEWPAAYRDSGSPEVAAFRAEAGERIAFYAYLQWLADRQLAAAAARAREAGMGIGLYRDLAVGADHGGSEIWTEPQRFAQSLAIGSPPDPFGPAGQNWGLPPFNPLVLEEQGLAAFRALVVANKRHAGAIRIDHAFQLQRLFLIPAGMPAAEGVYVDYPFEAMLAVLRLESHRSRSLVIAEDLGTAPEGFSDAIMRAGLLSYRVLWFERQGDGAFTPPEAYPRSALATFTTHDLPTFRGWWRGLDVDLRESLGLYDRGLASAERAIRRADVLQFTDALTAQGLLPAGPPEEPPLEAMARFLARTSSALVGIQLEDAAGELNQANLPGPDVGHPNWRRRLPVEIGALAGPGGELARLAAALAEEGRGLAPRPSALATPPPRATYRLQFHKAFGFDDAAAIVPYLARLGVSHLYASPILTARPGSTHGYDIVDHTTINPELGGAEGFRRLGDALAAAGLGFILDIVPNHMGIGGADNAWWLSVLEWGELSPRARAFDIDWQRLDAGGKLIVPFLGRRYGEALEAGELPLAFDDADGGFSVWHFEHRFPISPLAYPIVLDRALAALADDEVPGRTDLLAVSARLRSIGEAEDRGAAHVEECEALKRRLAAAVAESPALRQAIERALSLVNGTPGIPESFDTLHRILESQAFRLAHWRVAASDINYRRFFDINALAGLRVEDPKVFEDSHAIVLDLVREGRIQGLRIDHVDGLADPEGYVRALQSAVGPGFYIVVEKILEPGETLRPWPVAGTTGYDALNLIDGLFVERGAAGALERIYRTASGFDGRYGDLMRRAKVEVLVTSFASELEMLVSDLKRYADTDRRTRDYTAFSIRGALVEIISRLDVYRSYLGEGEAAPEDRALIEDAVAKAKRGSSLPDLSVHELVGAALLDDVAGQNRPSAELLRRFRRRFQQITGPVMAKSLEDTLFYRYGRLIALNEVGSDPNRFGIGVDEFHRENRERARTFPNAMIATATHDTKRGEDARARLLALSEMPDSWASALDDFMRRAATFARRDGEGATDENDQAILLQAILGALPLALLEGEEDAGALADFRSRMQDFAVKALREAKRHTSWVNADEGYEGAAKDLLAHLIAPGSDFLSGVRPLARRLAFLGMLNGLARTVLKATLPGVPDFYQGTELWDFALVDPDNRRPVDYDRRRAALEGDADWPALLASWRDGRIKARLTARLLEDRRRHPALYAEGDYRPLAVTGDLCGHLVAFERVRAGVRLAVVVSRLADSLGGGAAVPLGPVWRDAGVALAPGLWRDIVTGSEHRIGEAGAPIAELFAALPFSVSRMEP